MKLYVPFYLSLLFIEISYLLNPRFHIVFGTKFLTQNVPMIIHENWGGLSWGFGKRVKCIRSNVSEMSDIKQFRQHNNCHPKPPTQASQIAMTKNF